MTMSILSKDELSIKRPVNDPRDFAKPVKEISMPQDVPSTSDRRLIELKNKVQRLMEAHLAPNQLIQDLSDESIEPKEITNDVGLSNLGDKECKDGIKKDNEWIEYKEPLNLVNLYDESIYESIIEEMPRCSLNYYFRIEKGDLNNLKFPCMIGYKFIPNAYINIDLPMNIMSLAYYNDIRRNGFKYRGKNFMGIRKDMHVFIGNMSHVMDFTILESIEANIDPSLSVGIKRLLDVLEVIVAKVRVTAAKQNLVLFSNLNENYAK
ncbi:hypothetical protein Tco_0664646 [Tanacetum coccineum]